MHIINYHHNRPLIASMNKLFKIAGTLVAALVALSACNSTDDISLINDPVDYSSTAITSFSLRNDKSVLNNLDSVFFSIDLNSARIFNADSLPYGTDVSSIGINITTEGSAVKAIYSSASDASEKEVNLVDDPSAKLNFSSGAVKILVTSLDGEYTRQYEVSLNVHTVVPDSLYWSELARTNLPTTLSAPIAQKSVKMGDKAYCLTTDGASYIMSVSSDLYINSWQNNAVTFTRNIKIESLVAATDALYILSSDGALLTSTDGLSWTDTGKVWKSILGAYGNGITGVATDATGDVFVSYPESNAIGSVPSSFPVKGYSSAVTFSSKWSDAPQIMIFGGKKADGISTGAAWAFDGTQWAKISESLPAASGYAVVECAICETDTVSWRIKESNVLLAFGGELADGGINENVYMSRDMGMTWKKGDDYVQLPEYLPPTVGADILTFDTTIYDGFFNQSASAARSAKNGWVSMPLRQLPSIYLPTPSASRAFRPIESWSCPFLYMFGGTLADGSLQNALWRGVVNHFTFQPLQ